MNALSAVASSHAALSYVAAISGDHVATHYHLTEALRPGLFGASRLALPAAALMKAEQGDVERAVEFYELARTYGFVHKSRWFEDVVGRRIAAAAEALKPEQVSAARARGAARDLWRTLDELLQELKRMELS